MDLENIHNPMKLLGLLINSGKSSKVYHEEITQFQPQFHRGLVMSGFVSDMLTQTIGAINRHGLYIPATVYDYRVKVASARLVSVAKNNKSCKFTLLDKFDVVDILLGADNDFTLNLLTQHQKDMDVAIRAHGVYEFHFK
ncbi:hypothetical protein [Proteus mirabilis]|uniref:hypothetical protein n=1 Tax=Proteus mirabilis TaxID=584 RepID=UPI0034D530A1